MKRNQQIDFLRYCGITLVMINHLSIGDKSILEDFLKRIKIGGWVGVDLFFVLSGYLVSGLIIKEYKLTASFDPKRFLFRRGFKIYPTYYLFTASKFIFVYYITKKSGAVFNFIYEGIFLGNYFTISETHLWSISVEEHFYFLLSLMFFLLIKYNKVNLKTIFSTYIILLLVGFAFRLHNYLAYDAMDFYRDYAGSHIRLDSLFFGVLLSFVSSYRKDIIDRVLMNKLKPFYIILALAFISVNFIFKREDNLWIPVLNLAINPICFGYLIIIIVDFKNSYFLKAISPMSYIGMYSYSIYIFHMIFLKITGYLVKEGSLLYYFLYFALATFGGILISKLVEYPLINIREKYFPSLSSKTKVNSDLTIQLSPQHIPVQ